MWAAVSVGCDLVIFCCVMWRLGSAPAGRPTSRPPPMALWSTSRVGHRAVPRRSRHWQRSNWFNVPPGKYKSAWKLNSEKLSMKMLKIGQSIHRSSWTRAASKARSSVLEDLDADACLYKCVALAELSKPTTKKTPLSLHQATCGHRQGQRPCHGQIGKGRLEGCERELDQVRCDRQEVSDGSALLGQEAREVLRRLLL